ncbi:MULTISPECIES: SDR family NAD(P)-dependent oxidoreductase [unclassified Caulobacter]|uniref:SDR family NAD(P)-dependent oxidoreductase n=1 Tax=unclassified Caulobacter TaxID=2648921 RepID=UPI0006FF268D|nr:MULTISPECIES: SDR family oxidoreductase [unclassified Caulobacter]KQV56129.1 short-chain dehydrogenase [Caulobacter sp. Root342]KQV70696.1 short-chain dehydrogenase [Caulobacter sp. Root343]
MTDQTLSGRTVLITGASSGIGAHLARQAAAAGARVALAARRADRLDALVAEIGPTAAAFAMDVEDEASVIAAYDAVEERLGPPDAVIANAGISIQGMALDIAIGDFDKVLGVNTRGVFLTAREGARRMIRAGSEQTGRGRIVLVASIGAHKVLPGLTAYCTSKAATTMLGKSLAREWIRKGINVNVLCPGYIKTELNGDWFESEGGQRLLATFPRKRLMDEDDLTATALYLCSDAARAVTGSVFTVDDGQSL